jgi:hypothetical protein
MRIVIHIGLHKTASTYLQQHIFPRIDRRKVIYNPDDIFYFINSIFTLDLKDENRIQKANETVLPYRDLDTDQTLLISSEAISQLSFIQNYAENMKTLKAIFGEAEIVVFLREQSAWFESCYRESIKHHFYQDASSFLNFDGKGFSHSDVRLNDDGMLNMDVYKADWAALLKLVNALFPSTHVFLYEDFSQNNLTETNRLLSILCHPPFDSVPAVRSNPGLSLASIDALISYHRILRRFGLNKKTYMDKFSKERKDVLAHEYFWVAPKPPRAARILRALYREPARFFRRFSIHSALRYLDRKNPGRRKLKIFSADMIEAIKAIHAPSNSEVEHLLGYQLPDNYRYFNQCRKSGMLQKSTTAATALIRD